MKGKAVTVAGTAVLSALVVVLDYSLKYSGLKIPFPLLPYLKFDFTGAPVVLSTLLFGLGSGATTSAVALLAILARSGDVTGAVMKALAEFFTVFGLVAGRRLGGNNRRLAKVSSAIFGIVSRCAIMLLVNALLLPQTVTIVTGPLLTTFNVAQGAISIGVGYLFHSIVVRKTSFLTLREDQANRKV